DQKLADRTGAANALGVGHLRPADAGVALPLGDPPGGGQDLLVPAETPLQEVGPPPQREVRRVPPVHLEVVLAEPTVAYEPRLLRRHRAGRVQRRQVLRQHDATLQLTPARVAALREVNRPAALPKLFPV